MCQKITKQHLLDFLRHPLVVAIVSAGLFGAVVALVGASFQHFLWKDQYKIIRQKALYDKYFDKRAEVTKDIFYLIGQREKTCLQIFHTTIDMHRYHDIAKKIKDSDKKYQETYKNALECRTKITKIIAQDQDISCQINSLKLQIQIYFPKNHVPKLLDHFTVADHIWTETIEKVIQSKSIKMEFIQSQKRITDEKLDQIQSVIKKIMSNSNV